MPIYSISYKFQDAFGRSKSGSVKTSQTSHVDAVTFADTLRVSLQALTDCAITRQSVSEVAEIAATPTAGANIDAGLTSSFDLGAFKIGTHRVPAPKDVIFDTQGQLLLGNALVLAYEADMVAGALISDGEAPVDLLKGSLDK